MQNLYTLVFFLVFGNLVGQDISTIERDSLVKLGYDVKAFTRSNGTVQYKATDLFLYDPKKKALVVEQRILLKNAEAFPGFYLQKSGKNGVNVIHVIHDSNADAAGLRKDDLLLYFDKTLIRSSSIFIKSVIKKKAGEQVNLSILRNGERKELTMIMEASPFAPSSANPTKEIKTVNTEIANDSIKVSNSKPIEQAVVTNEKNSSSIDHKALDIPKDKIESEPIEVIIPNNEKEENVVTAVGKQLDISLMEAIKIGLENNYQIKLVKIDEKIALSNNEFGVPERLPRLALNLRELNRLRIDGSPTSFVDGRYTNSEINAGLDASWLIFDGYAGKINKRILEDLVNLGSGNAEMILQETINLISLSYYRALIEKEKQRVYSETLKLSQAKKIHSASLFNFGQIAKLELLNFKNAYLNDSISYQQQSLEYNKARISLKYLIGLNEAQKLNLIDALDSEIILPDFKNLENELLSKNIDLKNEMVRLKLAQHQIDLAKSARYPTIELKGGISEELGTNKFTGEDRENGAVFDSYLSVGLKYNIYNGNREKQRIEIAKLEQEMAYMGLDEKKRVLKEQLRLIYEDYSERKKILSTQEILIENLKESLILYKERYDSGYSVFIEYRNAQLELLNTQLKSLETIYQLKVAETEILNLTGSSSYR